MDNSIQQKLIRGVVEVQVVLTHATFQTEPAGTYVGTAFLVDKNNGLFFTAAHLVCGPTWGFVKSHNYELCEITFSKTLPSQDGAIIKCDPEALARLDLEEIDLEPTIPAIGSHVYLIGNELGHTRSILRGTISRTDVPADFHNFNVELIQASARGAGGVSGSPILNAEAKAVGIALSGYNQSQVGHFLPLWSIVKLLKSIENKQPLKQGTVHVEFERRPWHDCRELAKPLKLQEGDSFGALVVKRTLPNSPAAELLSNGDILTTINGESVMEFSALQKLLDANVGRTIALGFIRQGYELTVNITVVDMSKYEISEIFRVSGGTLHNLSYITALQNQIPLQGIFVAGSDSRFKFGDKTSDWVITSINGVNMANLNASDMLRLPDGQLVKLEYFHVFEPHRPRTCNILWDTYWEPISQATLVNGSWKVSHPKPLPSDKEPPVELIEPPKHPMMSRFVKVTWIAPDVKYDSVDLTFKEGWGIVLKDGIVYTCRSTIRHDLCDVFVHVSRHLRAKVLFMSEEQGWALLVYDVTAPIYSDIEFSQAIPKVGDRVTFFGMSEGSRFHEVETTISSFCTSSVSGAGDDTTVADLVILDSVIAATCPFGIVATCGKVNAFWHKYDFTGGQPVTQVAKFLQEMKPGHIARPRGLEMSLTLVSLETAQVRGVPVGRIRDHVEQNPHSNKIFMVDLANFNLHLRHGDIISRINGKPATWHADFDPITRQESVEFHVVRDGEERVIKQSTKLIATTDYVVHAFGLVLQPPNRFIRKSWGRLPSEAVIMQIKRASAAGLADVSSCEMITAVNGTEVDNCQSALHIFKQIVNETDFVLTTTSQTGENQTYVIRKTSFDTPIYEYIRDASSPRGWKVEVHTGLSANVHNKFLRRKRKRMD